MSLQHFFLEDQSIEQTLACTGDSASFVLDLPAEDIKHARALRLKCGEHIGVIDCNGVYFECEIAGFDSGELKVCVAQRPPQACGGTDGNAGPVSADQENEKHETGADITLIFGLMKGSKNDDVIRACTEIGVGEFVPFEAKRSVAKLEKKSASKKLERWQKIAKSAAMQSGQFKIPQICDLKSVAQLCEKLAAFDEVVIFWEEADVADLYVADPCELSKSKRDIISNNGAYSSAKKIAIVIGPEGGLCNEEVEAIAKANKNSKIVSLGSSILRAQTASILACGLVKYENDKLMHKGVQ